MLGHVPSFLGFQKGRFKTINKKNKKIVDTLPFI